ncbi:MAG: DUF2807 domain-containing protein [Alphaproteobacteria bacterium]|nr:DUF2807 domain-containing protein [Alphaproteobacteria bacterium]
MASQLKSILCGAAVAALLVLPAAAGSGDWTIGSWQGYQASALKVDSLVGKLRVDVKPQDRISVQVNGNKDRVQHVKVMTKGGTLVIQGENEEGVWDWKNWFNFSEHDIDSKGLDIRVVVPKGTAVKVEDIVGDATIGDTEGDLGFEAVSSVSTIGRVRNAKISMAGSGKIQMSDVMGDLHLEIAGSGNVKANSAKSVSADIAGSGSGSLGAINGGLDLDIAGSGDFNAAKVNGPVRVDIVGAGSVNIPQGVANPLHVDIMGAGNFVFGGEAVDPHISAVGSGRVKLRAYKGRMDSDGMVDVQIGPEGFPSPPPAPPALPAPPAPPAPPRPH